MSHVPSLETKLRARWTTLWQQLQAPSVPQATFDALIRAYSSPDRFYHTLNHIQDCLVVFDRCQFLADCPPAIELAIWFHDAIYDPHRSDNEQKSAEWAEDVIGRSGLDRDLGAKVADLILATRHQGVVKDRDAQMLVDVDLSILGREAVVFWQYETNIRREYAWVPESLFRQKRVEILRSFLNRSSIYGLKEYQQQFENRARMNLAHAIARLEDEDG